MDLKEFLNSGLLELSVLGTLSDDEASLVQEMQSSHSEVQEEIHALELFFEQDAMRNALIPAARLDKKMERMFSSLEAEKQMHLSHTPLISDFSDADSWLELVSGLLPKKNSPERFEKLLRHQDGVMQVLVVSSTDIEEETHEEVDESFLILKGSCVCSIGDVSIKMSAGDFMQIPLYLPHKVTLTSKYVTAILQHVDCEN
ncbi:mannose-6-phosphate isomerase-like protein (cupin superfamily) [Pedobacter sp. UYEF25]